MFITRIAGEEVLCIQTENISSIESRKTQLNAISYSLESDWSRNRGEFSAGVFT